MTLSLINNLESLSIVRGKINAGLTETEKSIIKSYDYVASPDLASGNVTAQTANSITDNTKTWTVNQYAGYVVRLITTGGVEDYCIVASNTATQLTFDDNHQGNTYASYRILSTFTAPNINAIYSFDIRTNDCGFILPPLVGLENRKFIRAYVEQATGDSRKVAIVCSGTDRQRGFKFGFLENKYEAVEIWVHEVAPKHWDILNLENIKRYSNIATTANQAVTSTTFAPIVPFASALGNALKRFDLIDVSGIAWLKYQSITTLNFHASGSLIIAKSGGGNSNVEVAIRIKRFIGGATEDSVIVAKGRFTTDETKTIPIDIAFELRAYDELTIIAKRDAGTITLEAGSNIVITEM